MLGENTFRSDSIDLDGVTLIFIESDFETILDGVVYWLSRVFDRTGVRGGINTVLSELLLLFPPLEAVAAANREVCEPELADAGVDSDLDVLDAEVAAAAAAAALALFRVVHRLGITKLSDFVESDSDEDDDDDEDDDELGSDDF